MADDRPEVRCRKNHLQTPSTSRIVRRADGSTFFRCMICHSENQKHYREARKLWGRRD